MEIKFQNGAHLKTGYFGPTFNIFLVTKETHKNSFSTYPTNIHTRILLTLLTFLPSQFWKKNRIYHIWFLFGVIPGVDSFSRHFGAINE